MDSFFFFFFYRIATSAVTSGLLMSVAYRSIIWCSCPNGPCSQGISRGAVDTCAQQEMCVRDYNFNCVLLPIFLVCEWNCFMTVCLRSKGSLALSVLTAVSNDMKSSLKMCWRTHKCLITDLFKCLKYIIERIELSEHLNLKSLSVCAYLSNHLPTSGLIQRLKRLSFTSTNPNNHHNWSACGTWSSIPQIDLEKSCKTSNSLKS